MRHFMRLELAAALGLGLIISAPAGAQELGYSISPSSKVVFGEVPYGKPTRTPNEIYNQNPLLPYKTPSTYNRYPTFEIGEAEAVPGVRLQVRRQTTTTTVRRKTLTKSARRRTPTTTARRRRALTTTARR